MSGKNVAASVKQRLLNRSRTTGEDFQMLLTRFAIERFLYRLSQSEHSGRFILKGANLFAIWTGELHRPTRDLDLLGFGDAREETLADVFRAICATPSRTTGLSLPPKPSVWNRSARTRSTADCGERSPSSWAAPG